MPSYLTPEDVTDWGRSIERRLTAEQLATCARVLDEIDAAIAVEERDAAERGR